MKCFIKTKQQQELKENIISRGKKKPRQTTFFGLDLDITKYCAIGR